MTFKGGKPLGRGAQTHAYKSGGGVRLVFTNQFSNFNYNHYVPGSGVGALNISVRRHLKREATSKVQQNGTFAIKGGSMPCCPELLQNYGYLRKSEI